MSPRLDVLMMARKQHRGNSLALPDLGACILRILQQTAVNALVGEAHLVGEDSLTHTGYCVCHHHCRKLAACQYIVADGQLLVHDLVDNALIHALIMTADDEDIVHF